MLIPGEFRWWDLLSANLPVLVIAFMVALAATPIARVVAHRLGIVDRPDTARKIHQKPTAYLGGMAVLLAVLAGIAVSWVISADGPADFRPIPVAIVVGALAIALTGLADDARGWDPRLKIAGQLVAAAALAYAEVGTGAAKGFLDGAFGLKPYHEFIIPGLDLVLTGKWIIYWAGTFLIAIFVLGGCNATNLIDGLDGLLSGVAAIAAIGLLAISLMLAADLTPDQIANMRATLPQDLLDVEGLGGVTLAGARVSLALAVIGAMLGFLVYNFNPASIFLGDAGSLLVGYLCVVMILLLGEAGRTHFVVAGLIVFSVPIIDTALAIVRRKMAGLPMSAPDQNHIHHMLHRKTGSVKAAVVLLWTMAFAFAVLGVSVAALRIHADVRAWIVYAIAASLFGVIGLVAVRSARRPLV